MQVVAVPIRRDQVADLPPPALCRVAVPGEEDESAVVRVRGGGVCVPEQCVQDGGPGGLTVEKQLGSFWMSGRP